MNYISIEQSKKLLELGVNPETADMHLYEKDDGWVTLPKGQISYGGFQIIPCWSVGALLDLLPKLGSKSPKLLKFIKDNKSVYCATYQSKEYHSGFFTTSTDAVFDLLLKVLRK